MSLKPLKNSSRRAAKEIDGSFSKAIALLVETAQGRDKHIIQVLATTGCTPTELVHLTKDDFNPAKHTLKFSHTKNEVERTVSISPQLTQALVIHCKDKAHKEYIFSTRQSPQLTTRRVEQILTDASKKAKVRHITPRDLRAAYQESAAKVAKDDEELKKLTGLKSISKRRVLSDQESARLKHIISKAPLQTQTLLTLISQTPIKLSEALTLTPQLIHSTHITLLDRHLLISKRVSQLLRKAIREENISEKEYVFSSRQSPQLSSRRAEQIISDLGIQAKISKLTSGILRATAIEKLAIEQGAEFAKEQAGLKTDLVYTHGLINNRTQCSEPGITQRSDTGKDRLQRSDHRGKGGGLK